MISSLCFPVIAKSSVDTCTVLRNPTRGKNTIGNEVASRWAEQELHKMKSKSSEVVIAVLRALSRARLSILTVGLTYLVSIVIGIVMVQTRNQFAISYSDRIVSNAQSSPIIVALDRNDRLQAALLDFGGNLVGSLSNTLSGFSVIAPYPVIAYRGWIGGIVSIDRSHGSRLADPKEATYYLTTLLLQLIPSGIYFGSIFS